MHKVKKMNKTPLREIVYYEEQHTLMFQDVTVFINEDMLKTMLEEQLSEETKRELIQTYYVCRLAQDIKIEPKINYGAWNAKIGDIVHIYAYEQGILDKIKGNVTSEEMKSQFKLINNNILDLSQDESLATKNVQNAFMEKMNFH